MRDRLGLYRDVRRHRLLVARLLRGRPTNECAWDARADAESDGRRNVTRTFFFSPFGLGMLRSHARASAVGTIDKV